MVILLSNIAFLAYWSYKMVGEVRNTLRTKMGKIYLYLCLCGNKNKLEEEKRLRKIKDENDILKEEFDYSLEKIRDLVASGELVLNRVNIEKIRVYLAKKHFLDAVIEKKALTPDEIKQAKRNKRRYEGERMHHNLMAKEDLDFEDPILNTTKNKTENYLYSESKNFENNLNKFLGIPIITSQGKKQVTNSDRSNITFEDEEESGYNKVSSDNKINPAYVLPEEKKVPPQLEIEVSSLAHDENASLTQSPNSILHLRKNEDASDPTQISKVSMISNLKLIIFVQFKIIKHQNSEKNKIERTITQDAEELGIVVPKRPVTEERSSKSQKAIEDDLLGSVKKVHKSGPNSTIKEESSDDDDVNSEVYQKNREEFFKQERLFMRKQKQNKASSLHNRSESNNTRVERIKEIKEKKVPIILRA